MADQWKVVLWSIERRHFQWPWTTLPRFQGHAILWRWISEKRYEIHSFNGILIGIRLTHALLNSVFSDLAKYSMTRSVTRFLCDSWASCYEGAICCRLPRLRLTKMRNLMEWLSYIFRITDLSVDAPCPSFHIPEVAMKTETERDVMDCFPSGNCWQT